MSEGGNERKDGKPEAKAAPEDHIVTVSKKARVGGRLLSYTVTTGTMILREEKERNEGGESEGEKPRAEVFFVAYTLEGQSDPARRPITFAFNGGPGSSSLWLHLGAFGPRRVVMKADGSMPRPPFVIEDNEASILDLSDLVFIDPVSTGYSRALPGEKQKDFLGFKKDIESVGDFIRLYASRNGRWLSPKFLAGESYGTTRAAGLSGYLQDRHGLYLNGVILVSAILDFGAYDVGPGNDLPYLTHLPTYAAIAWYHGRLGEEFHGDLGKVLREAEDFALGDYALALLKGSALAATERAGIIARLARLTGLSTDYLDRVDLRPEIMRFTKELLRDRRVSVGRLDGRFTGVDRDSGGEHPEYDPSMAAIQGPYGAALNDYVRRELGYESDRAYEILNGKTNESWSWEDHQNRYVEVTETLRKAICANPELKVFIASGYYDLATPYYATEYSLSHLGLAAELRPNISKAYYEAGHMMYIHGPSLAKLKADLVAFFAAAAP